MRSWARVLLESARSRWQTQGELDAFLVASKLALVMYDAIDDVWGSYGAVNDRLTALASVGATAEVVEEASHVMERVEARCRRSPEALDGWMRLYALGVQILGAYVQADDADRIERLATTIRSSLSAIAPSTGGGDEIDGLLRKIIQPALAQLESDARFHAAFARAQGAVRREGPTLAKDAIDVAAKAARASKSAVFEAMVHALARDREATIAAVRRAVDEKQSLTSGPLEAAVLTVAAAGGEAAAERDREARVAATARSLVTLLVAVDAWDEAAKLIERAGAERPLSRLPDAEELSFVLDRAFVARGRGLLGAALRYFEDAARGFEVRRRALRSERHRRTFAASRYVEAIYGGWASTLAESGDVRGAFTIADRLRARLLVEALGQPADAGRAERAQVERLTTQLASLQHRPGVDPALLDRVQAELAKALDALESIPEASAKDDALEADVATSRLPEGTIALAYLLGHRELLAWALDERGELTMHRTTEDGGRRFDSATAGARLTRVTQSIGDQRSSPEDLAWMSKLLLAPFGERLRAAKRVIVVPHAQLGMVPFAALEVNGRPLGMTHAVTVVPAAALLRRPARAPRPASASIPSGVLVVGDPSHMVHHGPDGHAHELAALPNAREEARLVAALHGATPLLGDDARGAAVRKQLSGGSRVVHLATHGVLEPDAPLASAVVLAEGDELTAADWAGLHLDADIVVLSACNTGRGDLQGGELVGLARAILVAGARAVLVSLWPVADRSTSLLMLQFHRQLCSGAPPDEALRRATEWLANADLAALDLAGHEGAPEVADQARDLRGRRPAAPRDAARPYRDPKFWAPFVVIASADE